MVDRHRIIGSSLPPEAAEPEFVGQGMWLAPPGALVVILPVDLFSHAGTNPRFTDAKFSTMEYYEPSSGIGGNRSLLVKAKRTGKLRALPSPPSNPFDVRITVTMTNDEGRTATATMTFETPWGDE